MWYRFQYLAGAEISDSALNKPTTEAIDKNNSLLYANKWFAWKLEGRNDLLTLWESGEFPSWMKGGTARLRRTRGTLHENLIKLQAAQHADTEDTIDAVSVSQLSHEYNIIRVTEGLNMRV
jgi:hypothetical protein